MEFDLKGCGPTGLGVLGPTETCTGSTGVKTQTRLVGRADHVSSYQWTRILLSSGAPAAAALESSQSPPETAGKRGTPDVRRSAGSPTT